MLMIYVSSSNCDRLSIKRYEFSAKQFPICEDNLAESLVYV